MRVADEATDKVIKVDDFAADALARPAQKPENGYTAAAE